jgi:2-phospho-L-lactate guanylyltransferase
MMTAKTHAKTQAETHAKTPAWTVVIPVKGTALAKSRLGIAEPDRGELALAFAVDTVSAALAAVRVGTVIVVTASDVVDRRMHNLGARTVRETSPAGLNPAIELGLDAARSHTPHAPVAVLLGDLPALDPADLDAALESALDHPMAMVADAEGVGTVMVTALRVIHHKISFGNGSRAAHLAAGYIELDVDAGSGLRRDVDTLADLDDARQAMRDDSATRDDRAGASRLGAATRRALERSAGAPASLP